MNGVMRVVASARILCKRARALCGVIPGNRKTLLILRSPQSGRLEGCAASPRSSRQPSGLAQGEGFRFLFSPKPPLQPPRGLDHIALGSGEREPDRCVAAQPVEVEAGGGRNARRIEHSGAEIESVLAMLGNVGIEIEGALGGKEIKPHAGQFIQKNFAVPRITREHALQLILRVKDGLRADLTQE